MRLRATPFRFGVAAALLVTAAMPASAQIKPLPPKPLGGTIKPVTPPPTAPLSFSEFPEDTVYAPYWSASSFAFEASGGTGTLTARIEVEGAVRGSFRLTDPQTQQTMINTNLAAGTQPRVTSALDQSKPEIRKEVRTNFGPQPSTVRVPDPQRVTVIVTDSAGRELRRSFTVVLLAAYGPPPALTASKRQSMEYSSAGTGPVPGDPIIGVLFNRFMLSARGAINFDPNDPKSEAICIYGSFRYFCRSTLQPARPGTNSTEVEVEVPDIGRGKTVQLVLRTPLGESPPVTITIDSSTRRQQTESFFQGLEFGKRTLTGYPGGPGNGMISDPSTACGHTSVIGTNLELGSIRPEGVIARSATIRLLSKPSTSRPLSTNNAFKVEADIGVGIPMTFLWTAIYTYESRTGICQDRIR